MKKILFVDDEPNVLMGLNRMLRVMRHEWEMVFVTNAEDALAALAEKQFDVIVSDMRMPGMGGAELLDIVRKDFPGIVRIALSGQSDKDTIVQMVDPVHQYLTKPCEAQTLKDTVERASALRELLTQDHLKNLVSQIGALPSLPALYNQLMTELYKPEPSIEKIEKIISQDVGMSAKILQLVNSAFFGMRRHIESPGRAVVLLGLDTIKGLALSANVFSQYSSRPMRGVDMDELWAHSMLVGGSAKQIAMAQGEVQKSVDYAYMAGMLHDVGKVILASEIPKDYELAVEFAREMDIPVTEAEKQVLGATHAEVGAYLLGLWGLPDPILEAIAYHHRPAQAKIKAFSPLTAVHVANAIAHQKSKLDESDVDESTLKDNLIDEQYLNRMNVVEKVDDWTNLIFTFIEKEKTGA